MSFFDSKEEVLEVELTPYGKHLLSKGLFKPSFYSFHDDGIIYDVEYAQSPSEIQFSSSTRIMEETPYLKTITRNTSVDKTIKSLKPSNYKSDVSPMTNLLGDSSILTDYKPAWDVIILKGEADRYEQTYTGSNVRMDIPQIHAKSINYETKVSNDGRGDITFEDGRSINIENNYLLLDISEINVDQAGDLFEIEVFEVKQDTDGTQFLEQIPFKKEKQYIKNNILLDEEQVEEVPQNMQEITTDTYFNLLVDDEIDLQETTKDLTVATRKKVKPPFGEVC